MPTTPEGIRTPANFPKTSVLFCQSSWVFPAPCRPLGGSIFSTILSLKHGEAFAKSEHDNAKGGIHEVMEEFFQLDSVNAVRNMPGAIHLKDKEPVYQKQFKIPDAHRDLIKATMAEWLKLGVVQRSNSTYNSPIAFNDDTIFKVLKESEQALCRKLVTTFLCHGQTAALTHMSQPAWVP